MFGKFYKYVSNLFGDDKKANADKQKAAEDAEEKRVRQYQRSAAFVALVQPNPRFANQVQFQANVQPCQLLRINVVLTMYVMTLYGTRGILSVLKMIAYL